MHPSTVSGLHQQMQKRKIIFWLFQPACKLASLQPIGWNNHLKAHSSCAHHPHSTLVRHDLSSSSPATISRQYWNMVDICPASALQLLVLTKSWTKLCKACIAAPTCWDPWVTSSSQLGVVATSLWHPPNLEHACLGRACRLYSLLGAISWHLWLRPWWFSESARLPLARLPLLSPRPSRCDQAVPHRLVSHERWSSAPTLPGPRS